MNCKSFYEIDPFLELEVVAYPVIHITQSEAKDGPVEFHLGVFWTPKSDFLRKLGVPFTMSDNAENRI